MQAYILFTSPALFIMTSEFWFMLKEYRKNHKFKWLFNLILFLLIALPVRYTIERIKPFEKTDRNPQWVAELKKLNQMNISNGILLNYKRPIEAMFYTNLTVYSYLPDNKTINDLISEGYTVIVNNTKDIPQEIIEIKEIRTINLSDPE
jgi:urease gamma subunit